MSEIQRRYIVMFEPNRPSRPSEYIREVVVNSISPCDAVRAAADRLDEEQITLWQADHVTISVRRTA